MQNPVWSLDMALNNESVVEQDLVAWLSMGELPSCYITGGRPVQP